MLSQHAEVFREGETLGNDSEIHVDGKTRPRFEKPRQVPFVIRKKVERELERLQALGILRPVQFSEWATPIVPIRKSIGRQDILETRPLARLPAGSVGQIVSEIRHDQHA